MRAAEIALKEDFGPNGRIRRWHLGIRRLRTVFDNFADNIDTDSNWKTGRDIENVKVAKLFVEWEQACSMNANQGLSTSRAWNRLLCLGRGNCRRKSGTKPSETLCCWRECLDDELQVVQKSLKKVGAEKRSCWC